MPVPDLFSKRRKREIKGASPEIYQYDQLPVPLRGQIIHIWRDALGTPTKGGFDYRHHAISSQAWGIIHDTICREKGIFALGSTHKDHFEKCAEYLLSESSLDDVMDIIELSFRVIVAADQSHQLYEKQASGIKISSIDAIQELNERFIEHAVGYQFANGQIIKIDRQFVHSEIVKTALVLLHEPEFDQANTEFMKAHEHYRSKNYQDTIVAGLRAFESVLKGICVGLKATIKSGDRASDLIKIVRSAGLFPDYLGSGFDSYVATMKTGLPEVRNNAGGHGAAPGALPVPGYIAAYAIHLTAANIVLCVEAYKAKRQA